MVLDNFIFGITSLKNNSTISKIILSSTSFILSHSNTPSPIISVRLRNAAPGFKKNSLVWSCFSNLNKHWIPLSPRVVSCISSFNNKILFSAKAVSSITFLYSSNCVVRLVLVIIVDCLLVLARLLLTLL